jgi:hypothetical protein
MPFGDDKIFYDKSMARMELESKRLGKGIGDVKRQVELDNRSFRSAVGTKRG